MLADDLGQLIVERAIQRALLLDRQRRIEAQRNRVREQLSLDAVLIQIAQTRLNV